MSDQEAPGTRASDGELFDESVRERVEQQRAVSSVLADLDRRVDGLRARIDDLQRAVAATLTPLADGLPTLDASLRGLRETVANASIAQRTEILDALARIEGGGAGGADVGSGVAQRIDDIGRAIGLLAQRLDRPDVDADAIASQVAATVVARVAPLGGEIAGTVVSQLGGGGDEARATTERLSRLVADLPTAVATAIEARLQAPAPAADPEAQRRTQQAITEVGAEVAALRASLEALQEQVRGADPAQALGERLDRVAALVDGVVAAVDADTASLRMQQEQIQATLAALSEAQAQAGRTDASHAAATTERLGVLAGTVEARLDEIGDLVNALQRSAADDLTARTEEQRALLGALEQRIREHVGDDARARQEQMRGDLDAVTETIRDSLAGVIGQIDERVSGLSADLDRIHAEQGVQLERTAAAAAALDASVGGIGAVVSSLRADVRGEVEEAVASLRGDVQQAVGEALTTQQDATGATLAAVREAVEQTLGELRGRVEAALTAQASRLEHQLGATREALIDATTRNDAALTQLRGEVTDEVARSRELTADRVGAASNLVDELAGVVTAQLAAGSTRLEDLVDDVTAGLARLTRPLEALEEGSAASVAALESVRRAVAAHGERAQAVESRVADLAAAVAATSTTLASQLEADRGATRDEVVAAVRDGLEALQAVQATLAAEVTELGATREALGRRVAKAAKDAMVDAQERLVAASGGLDAAAGAITARLGEAVGEVRDAVAESAQEAADRIDERSSDALGEVRLELAAATGRADQVATRLASLEQVLVEYLAAHDRRIADERQRLVHDLVDQLAGGLTKRDRKRLAAKLEPPPTPPSTDAAQRLRDVLETASARPPAPPRGSLTTAPVAGVRRRSDAQERAHKELDEILALDEVGDGGESLFDEDATVEQPGDVDPLATVRGLGAARRALLLETFGDLAGVAAASDEALLEVKGVGPALIAAIRAALDEAAG